MRRDKATSRTTVDPKVTQLFLDAIVSGELFLLFAQKPTGLSLYKRVFVIYLRDWSRFMFKRIFPRVSYKNKHMNIYRG